jgi:hypothetical protein
MDEIYNMMEKCNQMSDPNDEYELLRYSSSISLQELADSAFLRNSVHRYKSYLKYSNLSMLSEYHAEIICFLINDFLASTEFDLMRAAKAVSIDVHLKRLLDDNRD